MLPPQTAPFSLDTANKSIGNALVDLIKLMFPRPGTTLDRAAGQDILKSLTDGIGAGSQACTEVTRLRTAFTALRDSHRPKPHADPTAPGSLCAACSLHGALIAWPCETWTVADRTLSHGQS